MADTGPRGPQGPAGTSIDLPVAIENGRTGATTAAGAKENFGLESLACVTHEVDAATSIKLEFASVASALILATGTSGTSYAALVYNGYGIGGAVRVHIAELQMGAGVSYAVNDEDTDTNTNGLTITNANDSNSVHVSVLSLRGGLPTATTV